MLLLNTHLNNIPYYITILTYYIINEDIKYISMLDNNTGKYTICAIEDYQIVDDVFVDDTPNNFDNIIRDSCDNILSLSCYHDNDDKRIVKIKTNGYHNILLRRKETKPIINNVVVNTKTKSKIHDVFIKALKK